jgi:hypothetical protein
MLRAKSCLRCYSKRMGAALFVLPLFKPSVPVRT